MDSSEILSGRPFGGCGILYRKSLSPLIRRIFTSSQRLCAISLTLHNFLDNSPFVILFVCVYLPTDYSTAASHSAFVESLCELEGIISAENFDIIIAGDFNTNLSRPGSNFTNLTSFMSSHNLVCVDKLYNINYTYRKDDFSCFSSPDHILTYSNFTNLIDSVFTLDPVENFSDHLSLHFSLTFSDFLSFPCAYNSSVNSHCHPNHSHAQSSSSVNWFKVNPHHISSYCNHLSSIIPEFPNDIFHCCDPDCTTHHFDIDSYCVQLFNCIESSADLCLPTQGHRLRHGPLSGWNRSAHTLKQSAQFWHKLWSDCGCPTSGVLLQIKKNSKRRFKYEVRRLRHRQNHIVPASLRDCILVPIPKPGKDPSCSDNYRPIALAPKVFEWCLLFKFQSCFITSSLQFGFKPGFSSDLCTGLLKNVIHKYLVNNSHVYGCFLDASKAFDHVNHSLLFEKLLNKNLPPVIARLLLSWYSSQQLKVRWANSFSNCFHTTNCVRQGGVLSPILFTIYIDDLLIALEDCGVGCFWKHHFVGAVCYADDISLLAPSPSALR